MDKNSVHLNNVLSVLKNICAFEHIDTRRGFVTLGVPYRTDEHEQVLDNPE